MLRRHADGGGSRRHVAPVRISGIRTRHDEHNMSIVVRSHGEEPLARRESAADAVLDAVADRLSRRRLPEATYRLQFHRGLTFRDARELVAYLAHLRLRDCY